MHKELPRFITKLKERGFQVKLDTNGFFPVTLEECLDKVDYVAMDIKTSPEKYSLLGQDSNADLRSSVELLRTGNVKYEFRTTVAPEIVTKQDIDAMGEMVRDAKLHVLQQFIPESTLDKRYQTLKPYSPDEIREFGEILKKYCQKVEFRL